MSMLVLDLDHFKQVNDTYGHGAGDVALQKIADICRQQLRQVDIIGRLGGEEFVILLPDTNLSDAIIVSERLRQGIENEEIVAGRTRFSLTATIGAAELTEHDSGIQDLVRRADAALYQGKHAGRNRVEADRLGIC